MNRTTDRTWRMNRSFVIATALTVAAVMVMAAFPATAQEDDDDQTIYTRVGMWQVKRSHWSDFVEFFENYEKAMLEQQLADGLIVEYGIDAMSLHSPDGYTHSTWVSATSMQGVEESMAAIEEAFENMSEEEQEEAGGFADMISKHRDFYLESEHQSARAATLEGGYFRSWTVIVPRGKARGFHSFWENRTMKVYQQLLDDGVIVSYGLTTETITTMDPGIHSSWYVCPDAACLDAVNAAFDAWWGEQDSEGRRATWASIMDVVEEGSFHEDMTQIIHLGVADQ